MGIVYNRPTSSVLPNTCDLLLENLDQNAEKYDMELLDKDLIEEPQEEEVKVEKDYNEPLYFAEKYSVSNTVRFIGFLIDIMLISAISYALFILHLLPLGMIPIALIVFVLYYLLFEAVFSRTIGKLILRTKVVDIDGNKPTVVSIITRTIIRVVVFEAVSFVLAKGWSRHQYTGHWHDKWSDTYVVSTKKEKQ